MFESGWCAQKPQRAERDFLPHRVQCRNLAQTVRDDPAGTAVALKVIAASAPEDVRAAGARGLDYALSNLTREANLPGMIQLLLETADPRTVRSVQQFE